MMRMKMSLAFLCAVLLGSAAAAVAQPPVIGAEQVTELVTEKKAVLIDVRTPDEYRAGHIPGAISIPADRISADRGRLPRNKSLTLIFYCRGVG
jgi:rhodanese-related sulfurtransferase